MIKDFGLLAVAVAIVVMAAVQFLQEPVTVQVEDGMGTIVGPEVTERMFFGASFGQGGLLNISTSAAAITLTDRDLRDNSVINIANVGTAAKTLTLPASSSWPSLPPNGAVQRWIIDNQHTVAATSTTIAPGAGVDIDGDAATDEIIDGAVSGELACWRLTAGDSQFPNGVRCIVQENLDAN